MRKQKAPRGLAADAEDVARHRSRGDVASAGLVVGVAGPASADPTTTYVAVGSDTIQDVMNGFATGHRFGCGRFVGRGQPGDPRHARRHQPEAGLHISTRPNGSGEGLDALRTSLGGVRGRTRCPLPQAGLCRHRPLVQRTGQRPDTGQLVYIPFALDAVATATGPATAVGGSDPSVATAITHADQFTVAT